MARNGGKLNPETHRKIVTAIAMGAYDHVAAQYAGVVPGTFYAWLRKGRAAKSGQHRAFYLDVERAKAEAEVSAVIALRRAWDAGDWRAAESYLKRKHPDRWGQNDHVTVRAQLDHRLSVDAPADSGGGPRTLAALGLTDEQVLQIGRALAQAESGRLPPPE